jgi:hypothetical protein
MPPPWGKTIAMMVEGAAVKLVMCWAGGFLSCLIMLGFIYGVVHRRSLYEISVLRTVLRATKVLLLVGMALVLPLVYVAGKGSSPVLHPSTRLTFSWGRPLIGFMSRFLGLFMEYSRFLAWLCITGVVAGMFLDTTGVVDISELQSCIQSERCTVPQGYTVDDLDLLQMRDYVAAFESSWSLLSVLYASLIIFGLCGTRLYAPKQFEGVAWGSRVTALRAEFHRGSLLPLRW